MSKHTTPLYALVPITETEGLENGKWYIVKTTDGDAHEMLFDGKEWHGNHEPYAYLRPLPEGTVAVSVELLEVIQGLFDEKKNNPKNKGSRLLAAWNKLAIEFHKYKQFITTKLAQMGEGKL